jgi:hypothetical protein
MEAGERSLLRLPVGILALDDLQQFLSQDAARAGPALDGDGASLLRRDLFTARVMFCFMDCYSSLHVKDVKATSDGAAGCLTVLGASRFGRESPAR